MYSIRSKLIVSLLGVTLFVGAVSLFAGVRFFNAHVIGEAANRVRLDLNAASEMYRALIKDFRTALSITGLGSGFLGAVVDRNTSELIDRLSRMAYHAELDIAGIVADNGCILCRIGPNTDVQGTATLGIPIVRMALERKATVEGTVVLSRDWLRDRGNREHRRNPRRGHFHRQTVHTRRTSQYDTLRGEQEHT